MGGGSFDAGAYRSYSASVKSAPIHEVFKSRGLDPALDPKGVKIRESRDAPPTVGAGTSSVAVVDMRFFTSDLHFNHDNIIGYSQRPFRDVEHMNAELVARYNAMVGPEDEVYFVGDVFFGRDMEKNKGILSSMHGTKTLIRGNHDRMSIAKLKALGFAEVKPQHTLHIGGRLCLLRHYPSLLTDLRRVPEDMEFLIHGHTHTLERRQDYRIHIGVDAWNYKPVSEEEVVSLMEDYESGES